MQPAQLDLFDLRLLRVLQENGRLTNAELSKSVFLSPSQCQRRLKKLEELGVVQHYAAILDRTKIGLGVMAMVSVSLAEHSEESIGILEKSIEQNPQVLEGWAVLGEADYVLRVVTKDLEELSDFLLHQLLRLGVVGNVKSTILLQQTKYTTALPLD